LSLGLTGAVVVLLGADVTAGAAPASISITGTAVIVGAAAALTTGGDAIAAALTAAGGAIIVPGCTFGG
jgi:hypothetical protein